MPAHYSRKFLWILSAGLATLGGVIWRSSSKREATPVAVENTKVATKPPSDRMSPDHPRSDDEAKATANARPCDRTVLTYLDLTRVPTQAELIAAGNLGEPLTPTSSANPANITHPRQRARMEQDNLAFGTAIQAWNQHRYEEALELFSEHLRAFPASPWAAESMLHIGCHHQYVARFSESVEWFDKILAIVPKDTEMYHKAKLRRAIINVDLGRLNDATDSFAEMLRDDPSPNHQSYGEAL